MSSEDIEKVKQMLISYSGNVKMYAKWFDISEVDKNEETFTTYKVIYRVSLLINLNLKSVWNSDYPLFIIKFLPKDLNESIKELSVWKRFRDFKELYTFMSTYHNSLHRKEKFPEFVKSTFFGRFENKVIEERRQSALRLLQFIGSQSHLYKHEKFIEFLSVLAKILLLTNLIYDWILLTFSFKRTALSTIYQVVSKLKFSNHHQSFRRRLLLFRQAVAIKKTQTNRLVC